MNALVKAKVNLPAAFQKIAVEDFTEFTAGVTAGFPVISYRGKVWRIRKGGKEESYLDENGDAVQSVEIVLLKSNPLPSKTYYESKYEEGSAEAPRCWSPDGIKPDAGVQNPLSRTCAGCPKNVWGSKISETGSKTKACSDVRRMAVVFAHDLAEKGKDATLFLMRVPPASLNPLKDYVEKGLAPKGIPPYALVTRVGFDNQVAFPKLTFRPARMLAEDEAELVVHFRGSDDASRILSESHEFADEDGNPDGSGEASAGAAATAGEATAAAPSSSAAKPKRRPAEEEDVSVEDLAPAPKPAPKKAATPAPAPEEEEEEIPPAPAPKKAAAPKPEVIEGEVVEKPKAAAKKAAPAAPAAKGEDNFDAMLDSILNG